MSNKHHKLQSKSKLQIIWLVCIVGLVGLGLTGYWPAEATAESQKQGGGQTITLLPAYDIWINEASSTTNYSASQSLLVGANEFTQEQQAILLFSMSSIPDNATIQSARLELYLEGPANAMPFAICVDQITSNWGTGVTWNTRPSTTGPCQSPTVVGPTAGTTYTWSNLSGLVATWLQNSTTNKGLLLKHQPGENVNHAKIFSSVRRTSNRPRLVINYTLPSTPTPPPTPTDTPTNTPTNTPVNTPTPTATATNTPQPTATNTPLPPTPTNTPLPSSSLTAVIPPAFDIWINEASPTTNYNSDRSLFVGADEFTQEKQALMLFDLGSIPSDATIQTARLESYLEGPSNGLPFTICVDQITSNWGGGVTWNTRPSSSSVCHSQASVRSNPGVYYAWNGLATVIQGWLQTPSSNRGLLLKQQPGAGANHAKVFASVRQAGHRPRLVIEYTLPGTPTPIPPASGTIRGLVWTDTNKNGAQDGGEAGLAGVSLELQQEGRVLTTATTDSSGRYKFDHLTLGTYTIDVDEVTLPLGYIRVSGTEPWSGTLPAGGHVEANFGYAPGPTPTPWPSVTTDLFYHTMEYAQVTRNQGRVLIEGKPTVLRVYVGVRDTDVPVSGVTGRLIRVGVDDWSEGLPSDNSITVVPGVDPYRSNQFNYEGTLNFTLPDDWRRGGYEVNVWINYGRPVRECLKGCTDNNVGYLPHNVFRPARPLKVSVVRVIVDGLTPSREDVTATLNGLKKYLPTDRIDLRELPFGRFLQADYDYDAPSSEPGICNDAWSDLLDDLDWLRFLTTRADDTIYYGLLAAGVPTRGSGCGQTPGRASAGKAPLGWVMAHEVIHNIGREHAPSVKLDAMGNNTCSDPGDIDPSYPNGTGNLEVYGIDLATAPPLIFQPQATWDMMSYCGPRWMSQYTYEGIYDDYFSPTSGAISYQQAHQHADQHAVNVPPAPANIQPDQSGNYIVISGRVGQQGLARIYPFYRLSLPNGSSDGEGTGDYSIELQDNGGNVLFKRRFEAGHHGGGNPAGEHAINDMSFREVLPYSPGTAKIVIKHESETIYERPVSQNAPQVALLSPNGGETWGQTGRATVRWTGSDPDGDALHYVLQYSKDSGQTWQAIVANTQVTAYEVDLETFAGSEQALIRVTASDGVNTAVDTSDTSFTVAGKAPSVFILTPQDGVSYRLGHLIEFDSIVTDLEDGLLDASVPGTVQWSSDRQGVLGQGHHLTTATLETGWHTITLTAKDSDGNETAQSVRIHVGSQIYLPLIVK